MRDIAYVAIGSNLGDREANLALGRDGIAGLRGTRILSVTPPEETEPLGPPGQGRYLNQMVALETTLVPHELLAELLGIERRAGRVRGQRWGARTLDLDIVAFDRQTVNDATLIVPHPELAHRDFWQRELDELRGASR
jgi:2-amino-4-hydroxy-6-hydroxymethyldihydropteridine diphosphokinase